MQLIEIAIRTALAAVFAIAAASKLRSRAAFDDFVDTLPELGPPSLATVAGAAVVALELAAPVLLLASPRAGLVLVMALLGGFTAVMVVTLRTGGSMTCRCFGASEQPIGAGHVVRNALLIAAAAGAAWLGVGDPSHPGGAEVGVAMALGAISGVLITRWDDLAFIYGRTAA
jgi:hypothetical protein